MRLSAVLASSFGISSRASLLPVLSSRQADSAVDASAFLRRAYHASAVLDNWVYIDGGEFSYSSSGSVVYEYSSTLIAINLSDDWTNSSVSLISISKPSGAPNLNAGGMWVDDQNKILYTGFAGVHSGFGNAAVQPHGLWSFTPDGNGGGSWQNQNGSADSGFMTDVRPYAGEAASVAGTGYYYGGFTGEPSTFQPIDSLLSFDFSSKKLSNVTVGGISTSGLDQFGRMVSVPNFGPGGLVVSVGGDRRGSDPNSPGSDDLIPFDKVQVFDPQTGAWYEQATTGDIPAPRKEFCAAGAASNNATFEIFVYAGWGGILGSTAVPYDEAFVLTLPGFHWVRADYAAAHPRHALSCEAVGGAQILTIGGLDTTQISANVSTYQGVFDTPDRFAQGLNIFDLSEMAFVSGYSSDPPDYTPADAVLDFYDNNPRMPKFNSSELQTLFETENFPDATSNTSSTTPAQTSSVPTQGTVSDGEHSSSSASAIAGGVVGGITGLALLAGLVWFFLRARRRRQAQQPRGPQELAGSDGRYYGLPGGSFGGLQKPGEKYEAPGSEVYELAPHRYQASPGTPEESVELPAEPVTRHGG